MNAFERMIAQRFRELPPEVILSFVAAALERLGVLAPIAVPEQRRRRRTKKILAEGRKGTSDPRGEHARVEVAGATASQPLDATSQACPSPPSVEDRPPTEAPPRDVLRHISHPTHEQHPAWQAAMRAPEDTVPYTKEQRAETARRMAERPTEVPCASCGAMIPVRSTGIIPRYCRRPAKCYTIEYTIAHAASVALANDALATRHRDELPEPIGLAPIEEGASRSVIRSRHKRIEPSVTINMKRLSKRERRRLAVLNADADELHATMPRTRGECINGPRPCPYVSCKHHLYLDVSERTGAIKLNFPDLEPDQLRESCALDVADRGGGTLEEVGELLNVVRERVRQIEERVYKRLRPRQLPQELRDAYATEEA